MEEDHVPVMETGTETDAKGGIFGVLSKSVPVHEKEKGSGHGDSRNADVCFDDMRDPLKPYKMDYPKRGVALIFNHEHFESKLRMNTRTGTQKDRDNLVNVLQYLGFEVEVHDDFTREEVMAVLKKAAKMDHSDKDCFVCCMLSHGELGMLYSNDKSYKSDDLWTPFLGDKCPTLVGKPKLFFIQACQGDKCDSGAPIRKTSFDSNASFKIPIYADFLIAYSTVPGYYSWRNVEKGSWFIQSLCDVLFRFAEKEDLLNILTIVSHQVAYSYTSNVPTNVDMDQKKQIPCVSSMLTHKLYLKSKCSNK